MCCPEGASNRCAPMPCPFTNRTFQSLGLSYAWKIEGKSGETVPEIEVRLGAVDPRHLLGQERTLCGGILIKTIDSSKLKVAIEPSPPSGLLMTFNYQTDVAARRDDLVTGIEHFVATKDESSVLTRRFCGIEE